MKSTLISNRRRLRKAPPTGWPSHRGLPDRRDPRVARRRRVGPPRPPARLRRRATARRRRPRPPSCWSIKQNYPTSADGIYWLRTNTLVQPTAGLLRHDHRRRRLGPHRPRPRRAGASRTTVRATRPTSCNTITGPAAFAPAALGTETVNGLMNGGRMDGLTDGLRVRRARNPRARRGRRCGMHPTNYGQWSWAFGGGIYLNRIVLRRHLLQHHLDRLRRQQHASASADTTGDRRTQHLPAAEPQLEHRLLVRQPSPAAANNSTSYLWQYTNEGQPLAVRPGVHPAADHRGRRHQGARCPTPAHRRPTVRGDARRQPAATLPWQVTNLNVGADRRCARTSLGLRRVRQHASSSAASSARCSTVPAARRSRRATSPRSTSTPVSSSRRSHPSFNGPVHEFKATPDGKLIVAR